ncbi:MAG: endolytic transglycosylase MltG [Patescibacteria group bacterium]
MRKVILSSVVVVILLICFFFFRMLWAVFWMSPSEGAQDVTFNIESGATATSVSAVLKDSGLVENAWQFELYLKSTGQDKDIQAGDFMLKPGMNYSALANALKQAGTDDIQITIPEGFNIAKIGERVREALPNIDEKSWGLASRDLEGFLFPDTYRFSKNASSVDVITKMSENFEKQVAGIDIQLLAPMSDRHGAFVMRYGDSVELTAYEVVTLASIIQKEVSRVSEMRNVADIFLKRLDIGMALQADSTVNYITGKNDPGAKFSDLEIDSPYNTYKYNGLPLGPICNPGIEAIKAVLGPQANDYLYFLTTPQGEVKYAKTLAGHNANRVFLE